MENLPENGQARDEIVISPEMISAGQKILEFWAADFETARSVAVRVFRAMAVASSQSCRES